MAMDLVWPPLRSMCRGIETAELNFGLLATGVDASLKEGAVAKGLHRGRRRDRAALDPSHRAAQAQICPTGSSHGEVTKVHQGTAEGTGRTGQGTSYRRETTILLYSACSSASAVRAHHFLRPLRRFLEGIVDALALWRDPATRGSKTSAPAWRARSARRRRRSTATCPSSRCRRNGSRPSPTR